MLLFSPLEDAYDYLDELASVVKIRNAYNVDKGKIRFLKSPQRLRYGNHAGKFVLNIKTYERRPQKCRDASPLRYIYYQDQQALDEVLEFVG